MRTFLDVRHLHSYDFIIATNKMQLFLIRYF